MTKLLICDDDPSVRDVLAMALEDRYEVHAVANGRELVDRVVTDQRAADVVVLDVMMPEMNGFEALRYLRNDSRTAGLPVVMLTARVTEDDFFRGYDLGADAYLSKPFELDELLHTLDEVMAATPEQRAEARVQERAKASLLRQLERRFTEPEQRSA